MMRPMIRRLFTALSLTALLLCVGGCCGLFAGPNFQVANRWVKQELPIGSNAAAVERFTHRHGFRSERADFYWLELPRLQGTWTAYMVKTNQCYWDFDVIVLAVLTDAEGKVAYLILESHHYGFS